MQELRIFQLKQPFVKRNKLKRITTYKHEVQNIRKLKQVIT